MQLPESRFITFPDTLTKTVHTVLMVDAAESEIYDVGLFLKLSKKTYDVYLYKGDSYELEWLSAIIDKNLDQILISDQSAVWLDGINNISFFGSQPLSITYTTPLAYFQIIDEQ